MDLLRQILPCEQDLIRGHYRQHLDHGIRINCGHISCILQVCLGDEILRLTDSASSNFSYLSKRLPPYIFRHFIIPNFLDRSADSSKQDVSFCKLNLSRETFSFVEYRRKFLLLHFLNMSSLPGGLHLIFGSKEQTGTEPGKMGDIPTAGQTPSLCFFCYSIE